MPAHGNVPTLHLRTQRPQPSPRAGDVRVLAGRERYPGHPVEHRPALDARQEPPGALEVYPVVSIGQVAQNGLCVRKRGMDAVVAVAGVRPVASGGVDGPAADDVPAIDTPAVRHTVRMYAADFIALLRCQRVELCARHGLRVRPVH